VGSLRRLQPADLVPRIFTQLLKRIDPLNMNRRAFILTSAVAVAATLVVKTSPARDRLTKCMVDVASKYGENVRGRFYVDDKCIDCDLCGETAPANFRRNDEGGYYYVFKQPTTPEEEALCKEAMEGCPVEAIGDDGAQ
jgi:ferredoxin